MKHTDILLESGTNELEIVEFFLHEDGGDSELYTGYYGVNVAKVLEIIRKPKITVMPNSPHPAVLGAFTQRTRVTPLVDLGVWLGKEPVSGGLSKVIVTEFNKVTTAFLVSGVTRIHRISWEEVAPPDEYMASFSLHSITGVVKLDDRIVFLLDLEKIVMELDPHLALKMDDADAGDDDMTYRALVVDDSSMVRTMLKNLLQKAGFEVTTDNDGRSAWERLSACKEKSRQQGVDIESFFHVVVSDIEMPSMDGLSLTKKIKNDPILGCLPVILFSSLISERLRHKGESVGADGQISKPEVGEMARLAKQLIKEKLGR
ncbi:MAG: chemotaxis protein [Desulfovibrionales bacterium]